LRVVCQPREVIGRPGDEHWAGRLYMRRGSIYATWALVRLEVSANTVTLAMVGVGILAAAFFALPGLVPAILGAILVQAYLLLDCSDGEVARWMETTSVKGVYLDRLGHYVVEASLAVGLGIRAADADDLLWVVVGLATAVFILLIKSAGDLVTASRARAGMPPAEPSSMPGGRVARPLRKVGRVLPIHRLIGAVELSLAAMVAAVVDTTNGGVAGTRTLMVAALAVSVLVFVVRVTVILGSRRFSS
jgi:phosphatidylglycerophosphate synthase